MEISSRRSAEKLIFKVIPNADDLVYTESRKGKLAREEVFVECKDLHPDLYALAGLLLGAPFAAREITFDRAVSQQFAAAAERYLQRIVGPVANVEPRLPGNRNALAFSGGVDSVAAMAILPADTIAIFLNRQMPPDQRSLYKPDAAIRSCDAVAAAGRQVIKANTDLEYIRNPVGFPVDWSNAAPAVVLADELSLGSISFGMIAESAFFLGHKHYSGLKTRAIYKSWAPLFEAAGLPICLPTSGVSEVVTSTIAADYRDWHPQSCVRGTAGQPCGRCFKCFRKTLLDSAISKAQVKPSHFDDLSKEVVRRLLERPVHHENVLAYSVHKMPPVDHKLYEALVALTKPIVDYTGLDFMERLYPDGLDYVPPHLRGTVASGLTKYAEPMRGSDISKVETWDLLPVIDSTEYRTAGETLTKYLTN